MHPIDALTPVMGTEEALAMIDWAAGVTVNEPVLDYMVELCAATREEPAFTLGAGPRASLALMWATRVLAASEGREDVYPDDVKTLLPAVMGHRVMLSPDASLRGDTVDLVLERVLTRVRPPSPATVASTK
jgi:MoxR-like ATPase